MPILLPPEDQAARDAYLATRPPTTTAVTPTTTATGGGGGGGGASFVPPPFVAPPPATPSLAPPPPAAPTGGGDGGVADLVAELNDLSEEQIAAAIAAIETEYGLTRTQLMADKSSVGSEYRLLIAHLNRAKSQALQDVTNSAQERGLLRSGIRAEQQTQVARDFAEQEAAATAQKAQQEQAITAQLSALPQLQENAIAQAAAEGRGIVLDVETIQALAAAGLA